MNTLSHWCSALNVLLTRFRELRIVYSFRSTVTMKIYIFLMYVFPAASGVTNGPPFGQQLQVSACAQHVTGFDSLLFGDVPNKWCNVAWKPYYTIFVIRFFNDVILWVRILCEPFSPTRKKKKKTMACGYMCGYE